MSLRMISARNSLLLSLAALGFVAAGSPSIFARNSWELTPEEQSWCSRAAPDWVQETSRIDGSRFPPQCDRVRCPFELPLALTVYNKRGSAWSGDKVDEREIAYHLKAARFAWNRCGIEVTIDPAVRFVKGQEFLESLDRASDNGNRMGDRTRCFLRVLHRPDRVNVFFIRDHRAITGENNGHAMPEIAFNRIPGVSDLDQPDYVNEPDRSFIGSIFVTDRSRSESSRSRPYVFPHEIGHVILNSFDWVDRSGNADPSIRNLMNAHPWNDPGMSLTAEQCATARASRFIRPR